jgi:hypothetical protein
VTTWIADTSILCEYLEVPSKCANAAAIQAEFGRKRQAGDRVIIPLIVVLEVGNHIGQNGNSRQRAEAAERLAARVRDALHGRAPFQPSDFPDESQVREWLDGARGGIPPSLVEWVRETDSRGKGSGLGDLAIIGLAERIRRRAPGADVRIWTLDAELQRRFEAWK